MTGVSTDELTLKRLLEVLDYDPLTGEFIWAIAGKRMHVGMKAGSETQGYINISIDGVLYRAHRLAWLYMRGRWPEGELDHINNDGTDNRIANLRLATRSQNMANARVKANSRSGLKGVHQRGDRWLASIGYNGKRKHIGVFASAEEAHKAYADKARELRGDFARSK